MSTRQFLFGVLGLVGCADQPALEEQADSATDSSSLASVADGDDASDAGQVFQGNDGESGAICSFVVWESPEDDRREYSCTGDIGDWECDCAGRTVVSNNTDGEAGICTALLIEDVCGVTRPGNDFCESRKGEVACWRDSDVVGAYTCLCESDPMTATVSGMASCGEALTAACSVPCTKTQVGGCVPLIGSIGHLSVGYECTCDRFDGAGREVEGFDCSTALSTVCEAEGTDSRDVQQDILGSCNHAEGVCQKTSDGFDCWCRGTASSISAEDDLEGEVDFCEVALQMACDGR